MENVGEQEPIYGTSSFLPSQQNSQPGHRNSTTGKCLDGLETRIFFLIFGILFPSQ